MLYGRARAGREKAWSEGATWFKWRIARQTPSEAAVEVELSSGGTSGVGYEVFLRKRGGVWCVVVQDMVWIS